MKPKVKNLLLVSASISLLAGCLMGCAALDPNADPIEVRAEQSVQTAFDTMDTFEQIELDNQALIKAKLPAVHQFAEYLREPLPQGEGSTMPRGIAMVNSANLVRRAYKANRTPENRASLNSAIASVEELINQVQSNIASWNAAKTLLTSTNSTPAPASWDGKTP